MIKWGSKKNAACVCLVAAAALGAAGCAEEREPINRVQPNALAKSFFVGEDLEGTADDPAFFARAVITDVGYGAAQDGLFTSTYAQPVSVIKWEITEDILVGRIVYNRIIAADGHGDGDASIDGQVAYAFPIISHFDIRRDYNPTTGEESNVIVENSSDRAWNEREYFRVDWSRNLNTDAYDFDTLSLVGVYGSISYEPLSYYVNDPNHPDAPVFATSEGYFDVTTKAYAVPGLIDLSHLGWGINSFPACYLPNDLFGGSYPFGNCNPIELTLRMSFRRAEASDYQPLDMDGNRFAAFGAFYGERFGYARNYGIVDSQWYRFAARFNVWEWHHAYVEPDKKGACPAGWVESEKFPGQCEVSCFTAEKTPPGGSPTRDDNANGTHDECEVVAATYGAGSKCDRFEQKCTLPYQKRTEKPLVWHYTKGSHPVYFEGSEMATHEWDVAMRTAVRSAKYSECMAVGGTQQACLQAHPIYLGQQEENEDAVALAREVDDCRAAKGPWAQDAGGAAPWSEKRVEFCNQQAASIGAARGYSAGVVAIAQMGEMITLCHSPVEYGDSPICVEDHQKYMPDEDKVADKRQVLPKGVTAAMCDEQFELRYDEPEKVDQALLATCDAGFSVRMGDLRYHQVNVIKNPQTPSPWGIMVDADDPRTGEKVQSSSNVWAHVNDLASQGLVDNLRYIAGELDTAEIKSGAYVRNWAAAAQAAGGKGALGTMDKVTLSNRLAAAVDGRSIERAEPVIDARVLEDPRGVANIDLAKMREVKKLATHKLAQIKADATVQSVDRPYIEARRLHAQGTETEAALITEPMMQLAGMNRAEIKQAGDELQAGQVGQSPLLASASILRGLNPTIRRELRQARELGLANRGACILSAEHIMAPAPNSLTNLVDVLERKFEPFNNDDDEGKQLARAETMRKWLATRFQYAVMSHEMGHSMALRHNFVSSSFAYGYRPQYWQLRTKNGTITEKCTDVSATGEECIGARYFDPPTDEEKAGLIWMFSHSTVMDYPGDLTQDLIGLGVYDFAAARFFYGDVMSVYNDGATYNVDNEEVSQTLLNVTGNFGGILGWDWIDGSGDAIHYSQIQENLKLIRPETCQAVDAQIYRPKAHDDARHGRWDPLIDGLIVTVNGQTTRCKTPEVDYVQYDEIRGATAQEARNAGFYGGAKAVEAKTGRLRAPYGFATDGWADLGNLAVYRHDNGADPYELFNFFITEQEARHIFDNYRRARSSFSVRTQSERILGRYNEKMRDGAKGLGLLANIFRVLLPEVGANFDNDWALYATYYWRDNILASGLAFDHFTRQLTRPQPGPHIYFDGTDLNFPFVSSLDQSFSAAPGAEEVRLFDGASGYFDQIAIGTKLVENRLGDGYGEFDRDYTNNAGSYYDKVFAPYLLTESVDNFISDSLMDFTDPRYRSVSMADLFQDGYRRLLANQLTNDEFIKGPRIASNGTRPLVDSDGYPSLGIGWVTWWTPEPEVCFPGENQVICTTYGCPTGNICEINEVTGAFVPTPLNPLAPAETVAVDPQVKWEEHKWLIAQTLLYLPENAKSNWINLMGIWELGADQDPGFDNRIELHLPDGRVYIAKTYGTETIFGKTVQRGVAARILEYANQLAFKAYECQTVTAPDGGASWCIPTVSAGVPVIKYDPGIQATQTCNAASNAGCTCYANRACIELADYESLPAFMRQSMRDFRMADASMRGIYD